MPNKMAQTRAKRNQHITKQPPRRQSFKQFWRKFGVTKAPRKHRRAGAKELWCVMSKGK